MSRGETRWRQLLDLALPALDYVFGAELDETRPAPWTLGGGTAIAIGRQVLDAAASSAVRKA